MGIRYDVIVDVEELRKVVDLEVDVWGVDCVDVVPAHILYSVGRNGGVLVGAYSGERLVGMCFGIPGRLGQDCFIWSHMTGIHQNFQGMGIGTQLKLLQRDWALLNDYTKILWTFDPLQQRNANFNIHKLQATANTYHINYYGTMADDINAGLPSDRLEVIWNLKSARSPRKHHKKRDVIGASSFLISDVDGNPMPVDFDKEEKQVYIEIPSDLAHLKKIDLDLALQWRLATREAFQMAFAKHYAVTDFVKIDNRYFYVLSPSQIWFMYVAECRDQTLYTGITNNLQRRIDQHNAGKGAAYTSSRRPITLLAAWKFPDRSSAQRAEAAFKKQKRHAKLNHIRLKTAYRDGEFITPS